MAKLSALESLFDTQLDCQASFLLFFYTLFLLHFFLHTRSSHNRIFLRIC